MSHSDKVDEKMVMSMIEEADVDGDGKINYQEFSKVRDGIQHKLCLSNAHIWIVVPGLSANWAGLWGRAVLGRAVCNSVHVFRLCSRIVHDHAQE